MGGLHQLLGQSGGMYVISKPRRCGFNLLVMHCGLLACFAFRGKALQYPQLRLYDARVPGTPL
jgi:hypothetical protein